MTIITKAQLAEKLRVSRSRVTQFLDAGMPKRRDGRVDLEQACRWIVRNIGPTDGGVGAVAAAQEILGHRDRVGDPDGDLFDIHRAAELLERDPNDLEAALQRVPPDRRDRYQRRTWRLATIVRALTRHGHDGGPGGRDFDIAWAPVEQADQAVRDAFKRIERVSDLEERRRMAHEQGVPISRLEEALQCFVERGSFKPGQRQLLEEYVIPQFINAVLSHFLYLCNWRIQFDEQQPAG
jgi:hypothetical protein